MFNNDWKLSINSKTFDALDTTLFKNYKFTTLMSFVFFVLVLTILKAALFISDIYTCVKLLAFDSWSNDIIKPYIPFRISKWLFSGCILASIVLMIWEVINGIRIYRTRNISLTYVNNFSRGIYSLTQYDKFCIFNKITPKGAYQRMAFFTFFELKDCIRLLLADTPRQVINGLTLWSVVVTVDNGSDMGNVENFQGLISKIKSIAKTNHEEAVLLSFMMFSFVIWAFFISKLLIACICSVFVYYRLFQDRKMSGLKEFVCITVSDKVDSLVEKYEKRKHFTRAYQKGASSTSSSLHLAGLEAGKWAANDYSQPSFNASTANLLQKSSFVASRPSSPPLKLGTLTSVDSIPDYDMDAVQATSPIVNMNDDHLENGIAFNAATNKYMLDSMIPQEKTFVPILNNNESFNSDLTTNTVPSYYFSGGTKNGNDSRRNLLNPLTLEVGKGYGDPIVRRKEPPKLKLEEVHSMVDLEPGQVNSSTRSDHRIYTPDKAYFGESALQSERTNQGALPQRTTSLFNRRERMENQDYEYYAQMVRDRHQ